MAPKRTSRHLRLAEANSFATEFMEALQQLPLSDEPVMLDDVATLVRRGMRSFEGGVPTAPKNAPPFLVDLAGPLIGPDRDEASIAAFLKKYKKELANPPKTGKGLHNLLVRIYLRSSPADVMALRQFVQKVKSLAANPLGLRDQLIDTLKRNNKGTPGPKKDPSWDLNRIVESSYKLHPVWREIFAQSKNSKQPLPEIIKAVSTLYPEWKTECDFLLANGELVTRSMNLSKIRKAKTRGKATMLANALACSFAGYDRAPSYSMQLVEQARRSQKRRICP